MFQWAPTLGGECYWCARASCRTAFLSSFNGHPPLGVNATKYKAVYSADADEFQWAPTLGGECYPEDEDDPCMYYESCFNGHPPLGVNAT